MREVPQSPALFRFGVFQVDVAAGELRKHGLRIRLQQQPFQVLLLLLEHAGDVVSREELVSRLWGSDTFVDFEQGLGTAIKKLRQALNDDADAPRFVQTLPKRGYRFIAPVERIAAPLALDHIEYDELPELVPEMPLAELPSVEYWRAPPSGRRPMLLSALFLGAGILGGAAFEHWVSSHQETASAVQNSAPIDQPYVSRPLTTFPGGEYEPTLSPDGKMVAFVWDEYSNQKFHVYTQAIDVGPPMRLTTDSENEASPVWSPDGRYVAFITVTANPQNSAVYVVPIGSGSKRKVASIAPRSSVYVRQIDWSPDGNLLAITDRKSNDEPWAIHLIALNTGARRLLLPPSPASWGDSDPVFSPDGAQISFRRTESIGNDDLYVAKVAGGKPRRITFDQRFTSGHAWTRTGSDIVFASKRAGPISLWRVKLSGGAPRPVAGDTEGAYYLACARKADKLVYSKSISDSNIWETDLSTGRSRCVLKSTRSETSPQYSPDGTRIVFRSDRTGNDEIWTCDSSGDHAAQLTSFNGPLTGTPRWSPDGQFIAFDSRPGGNPDIYVVSANGGPPRRITSAPAEDVLPSWSVDGQWLYFVSNRSGQGEVWKIAAAAENESLPPIQVTRNGAATPFAAPDAETVLFARGADRPGISSIPARGGDEQVVTTLLAPGDWGNWGVAKTGIFFITRPSRESAIVNYLPWGAEKTRPLRLLEKPPPLSDSGFAVRYDGRMILHTQTDQIMSEILLVDNFR